MSQNFKSVAYFANWDIYSREFYPWQLPAENLTHVLYAFANVHPNGTVFASDIWADAEKRWPSQGDPEKGTNHEYIYGCVNQLFELKKQYRNLKVSLSIGGYTYSTSGCFSMMSASESGRHNFAISAVRMMADWGFDGLDIDWEYPANETEAENMVLLLKQVREELDDYANSYPLKNRFLLTVAASASPAKYNILKKKEMDTYIDFWNIMAYDYAGSWDTISGHTATIFESTELPAATPFNTDQAVQGYISANISSYKLVLGMSLYGRGFSNTNGPGQAFNGVPAGDWEKGVYDYKSLPPRGDNVTIVGPIGASYSYSSQDHMMVSYDTPEIIERKARYIMEQRLGGGMWWEISGDRNDQDSLISTLVASLGGSAALEKSNNTLIYPLSPYENIRNDQSSTKDVQ
ncbi:glycoside hydrolase family 18 protein [Aspergillus homomorphus CBS 101889]|uniref:chitinase n=1 Tax=Aspergillus homomorphus (strain CBS 101889) TaxID=1450537 RepID=A0A395HM71_ASPHC|nr:glycoside hydrolase [Aspergillus homomorphus CBS 101889]RAL07958.1 glycoside hydrolase [Aspergillus homomorphus CBS 101889]